jgi:hypothetical protein
MYQAELIYSVKEIFSNCLSHYNNSQHFIIESYQRGYKWGANPGEPVTQLMEDLLKSFSESDRSPKEYFLQYVTLKPVKSGVIYGLEVIDGQQRLTTLSILLAVFQKIDSANTNVANRKIDYAIGKDFLSNWVYDNKISDLLLYPSWQSFRDANPSHDKQDLYYLYEAAKKIEAFLISEIPKPDLKAFYDHILKNIKLIVNAVETNVESERVFRNLNSHKVPLTEAELIKALLLTKAARTQNEFEKNRRFREVMDIRAQMGRQWDEMQNHLSDPMLNSVLLHTQTDVMYGLLLLTALQYDENLDLSINSKYPVFEFFQNLIKKGHHDAADIFNKSVLVCNLLREWNSDEKLYNSMGFLFYSKDREVESVQLLSNLLRKAIGQSGSLLSSVYAKILTHNIFKESNYVSDLQYGDQNHLIHDVLLLINVFPKSGIRFNFSKYSSERWSLEHIFPQNPKLGGHKLLPKELEIVRELVNEMKWPEIQDLLEKLKLDKNDEEKLNELMKVEAPLLNSIGNMALLPIGLNASVGNGLFDKKRSRISQRISEGEFVPNHTYNVFSKLILDQTEELRFWTKADIGHHKSLIEHEVRRIENHLNATE